MGSCFIRHLLAKTSCAVINFDLLTYAANLKNLTGCEASSRYQFVQGDIRDEELVRRLCDEEKIDAIVHFAAETHVDRSITDPRSFLTTNVEGTFSLLQVLKSQPKMHFHHISTDEVFGSLGLTGLFTEDTPYHPNSPYSASKAASDHFVLSFAHTFDLSVTLSHSSNNYGPCQNPEKFIPRMITTCLKGEPLPVYGKGENVRDWLFVEDHAEAVCAILEKGKRTETYNIGGKSEKKNLDLLHLLLEEIAMQSGEDLQSLQKRIAFVPDRPGHDFRYALDISKIQKEVGWTPRHSLKEGLKKTVAWYLAEENICV